MGITGGFLSVQCYYEEMYKGYNKYWCRGQYDIVCNIIVEIKGEEREERNGRVFIRDCVDKFIFIVIMENFNVDDVGIYWCRIQTVWILDAWLYDFLVQVKVFVFLGKSFFRFSSRVYGI